MVLKGDRGRAAPIDYAAWLAMSQPFGLAYIITIDSTMVQPRPSVVSYLELSRYKNTRPSNAGACVKVGASKNEVRLSS